MRTVLRSLAALFGCTSFGLTLGCIWSAKGTEAFDTPDKLLTTALVTGLVGFVMGVSTADF